MTAERVVIARRWTGLGDCLVSLAEAWRFARATDRVLVADWRGSTYDPTGGNLFDRVFQAADVVAGVPFRSGDEVGDLSRSGPYWPPGWTAASIETAPVRGESGQTDLAVRRIASGADVDEPVVVFDGCLADAAPPSDGCRELFGALVLRAARREAVRAFATERLVGHPVIGLHVRHGNGGDIMGHAAHWTDPDRTLLRLVGLVDQVRCRVAEATGATPVVLLCTDSIEVQRAVGATDLDVVVRPKAFRPVGRGELHRGPWSTAGLADGVVEMVLLAETDVLVRFPAGSFFSAWGAACKRPAPIEVDHLVPDGLGAGLS